MKLTNVILIGKLETKRSNLVAKEFNIQFNTKLTFIGLVFMYKYQGKFVHRILLNNDKKIC